MLESSSPTGGNQGPATDSHNEPVIDPTKNVENLVAAQAAASTVILNLHMQRQDDLRNADNRRQDDLRQAESAHIHEIMATTSRYEDLLRQAETNRINAIRTVDVNAVAEAARVSAAQALTLANQVATSAETLRTQVSTVATATATALANALEPLQKAIEDLRKTQYQQQGEKVQRTEGTSNNQWLIGAVISIISIGFAVAFAIVTHT